jgi:hypothetical protein
MLSSLTAMTRYETTRPRPGGDAVIRDTGGPYILFARQQSQRLCHRGKLTTSLMFGTPAR